MWKKAVIVYHSAVVALSGGTKQPLKYFSQDKFVPTKHLQHRHALPACLIG